MKRRAKWGEAGREFDRIMHLPPTDDCLDDWPFATTPFGYPYGQYGPRLRVLTQVACELHHGPPPSTAHETAHGCGNQRCLNPRHLRWATHVDNEADKIRHGTTPRGPRKFTIETAEGVRRRYSEGLTMAAVAVEFGMSRTNVHNIVHRNTWKAGQ